VFKARAEGFGLLLPRLEGGRRRSARHQEKDGAKRVVVSNRGGVVWLLRLDPRLDVLVAELEAALIAAADDLAPHQLGFHTRLQGFDLEARVRKLFGERLWRGSHPPRH